MFSPLFSHIFFYFIRFTASNDLLLSSKDNVSIFIGVTTGFPGMSPLSTCLNYFIMVATHFSPFLDAILCRHLVEHEDCFHLHKGIHFVFLFFSLMNYFFSDL